MIKDVETFNTSLNNIANMSHNIGSKTDKRLIIDRSAPAAILKLHLNTLELFTIRNNLLYLLYETDILTLYYNRQVSYYRYR